MRLAARSILAHHAVRWWVAALAMALAAPTLGTGFVLDDFVHAAMARAPGKCLDLFSFVDARWAADARQLGLLPWYTPERFQLSFWRPLASVTHCVDYRFALGAPAWMHLENVLWLGAAVVVAGAAYRRLSSSPWVAGLATCFYGLSDARGPAVGWLANRNALMAAVFGALAVWALDWFGGGRAARRWLGPALGAAAFACALLSAEAGLQALGYVLAYVACVERGPVAARFRAIAPYGLVLAAWGGAYRALGHGVYGSSLYLDPLGAPAAFARAAVVRLPVWLSASLGVRSADAVYRLAPGAYDDAAVACVAVLAATALVLEPVVRRVPRASFWALGAGLAALAACAGPLADRAVGQVTFGAAALAAEAVAAAAAAFETRPSWRGAPALLVAAALGLRLGVAAPVLLGRRVFELDRVGAEIERQRREIAAFESAGRVALILRAPDAHRCALARVLDALSTGTPASGICLGGGPSPVTVTRVDARSVRVRPDAGFLDAPNNRLYASPSRRFAAGDELAVAGVAISVDAATADGAPAEVTFRLPRPLDAYVLLAWDGERYVEVALPPAREPLRLGAIPAETLP